MRPWNCPPCWKKKRSFWAWPCATGRAKDFLPGMGKRGFPVPGFFSASGAGDAAAPCRRPSAEYLPACGRKGGKRTVPCPWEARGSRAGRGREAESCPCGRKNGPETLRQAFSCKATPRRKTREGRRRGNAAGEGATPAVSAGEAGRWGRGFGGLPCLCRPCAPRPCRGMGKGKASPRRRAGGNGTAEAPLPQAGPWPGRHAAEPSPGAMGSRAFFRGPGQAFSALFLRRRPGATNIKKMARETIWPSAPTR